MDAVSAKSVNKKKEYKKKYVDRERRSREEVEAGDAV